MQMFWKQRQTFLNPKYKGLGLWAMPNILLFQYIIPFFSPLADVIMFLEFYPETEKYSVTI
jgi:hypothetical protein